jgi:plastocyanin domain-containing protein
MKMPSMKPPTKPRNIHGLVALVLASAACLGEACSKPAEPSAQAATMPSGTPVAGRRIAITASSEGYAPATVEAKKGEQVVLVFTRTTKSDCLAEVVIPDLNVKKELPLNTPVEIPVKLDKEGKVPFQCGMAMVKGTINVSGS